MKPQMLSHFFDRFKENKKALKVANELGFKDIDHVIEADQVIDDTRDPRADEFHNALIDLAYEEQECIDGMELDCLSSHSTTTSFYLMKFCGVYWIENFEMGDLSYFSSEEDAKAGFKEEYGIDWGSEESPFSGEITISGDDLFDDDDQ